MHIFKAYILRKGAMKLSKLPNGSNGIPNIAVDLLVSEVFRKNGVNLNKAKSNLTDEQKTAIKDLVEELKMQVDSFVKQSTDTKKD